MKIMLALALMLGPVGPFSGITTDPQPAGPMTPPPVVVSPSGIIGSGVTAS